MVQWQTSREKLNKLRFETIYSGWFRKLCAFYKIVNEKSQKYLYDLIPKHTISEILKTFSIFRSRLLKQIRSSGNSIFNVSNMIGIQHLARLRLRLSHLREHKFRHHSNDTLNPPCPCNSEVESLSHFFLHCHFFDNQRIILMNEILNIDPDINLLDDISISNLLLYGSKKYSNEIIKKILEISIKYILTSKRFEGPLFLKGLFLHYIVHSMFLKWM